MVLNIVGCCCRGPGYTRLFAGFDLSAGFISVGGARPINPTDILDEDGNTKRWPCWAVAWHDPLTIDPYNGEPAGGPLKATIADSDYPHVVHHLVFNTKTQELINGSTGAFALDLIRNCRLSDPAEVSGGGSGGGAAPNTELVSAIDGAAIIADALPSGAWTLKIGSFSGATNDRLYGFNYYSTSTLTGDSHFKAWSVNYSGGDYTEEFVIDNDGSGSRIPVTMNVVDGEIFCVNTNGDGDVEIYQNGSIVATMGGLDVLFHNDRGMGAVATISGQLIACLGQHEFEAPVSPMAKLCVVDDGEDVDDRLVTFVAIEDESDVAYYPRSMGWDPKLKCPVVVWDKAGNGGGYMTYITKPIEPGNIIEQDGVKIYANFPSVGYCGDTIGSQFSDVYLLLYQPSPLLWGVVIPGRMPRPLKVTAGVIEQPPPPTPEPTCDGLEECPEIPGATLAISLPPDYTDLVASDIAFPYGEILVEYFPSAISDVFNLLYVASSFYNFHLPLVPTDMGGAPITADYSQPGRLIVRKTATDTITYPHTWQEFYAYEIYSNTSCTDGQVTMTAIGWTCQLFEKLAGDDPLDPPNFGGEAITITPSFVVTLTAPAFRCHSGQVHVDLSFTNMIDGTAGTFNGSATISMGLLE